MIDTDNVGVTISKKRILESLSIHVDEGEFVGLIGPNGSGKSTLLKTIYRVLKPTDGAVFIGGENIDDMTLGQSALKVSVVSQHNYYNFDFTVEEVVMMGRAPHKKSMELDNAEDLRIVSECLEKVCMDDYRDRNFFTLSGGEQQRIILARALAQETPCILLDEPTNHLDIRFQLQILDLVKTLGSTVLCALHDMNLAAAYCDRIYLLKDGEVCSEGTPEEVLTEEMIKRVYGVEAFVEKNRHTGHLNIVYRSALPPD
ncbi:MAG: ABC transporter ATP-binding protein [Candidatus Methanoplasma sp.]|jgi:iron complex transport system ATP-binding protein|nr:ABC transporter ATP-binding protein [Candidatus Methanoplasma sp.]